MIHLSFKRREQVFQGYIRTNKEETNIKNLIHCTTLCTCQNHFLCLLTTTSMLTTELSLAINLQPAIRCIPLKKSVFYSKGAKWASLLPCHCLIIHPVSLDFIVSIWKFHSNTEDIAESVVSEDIDYIRQWSELRWQLVLEDCSKLAARTNSI